MLDLNAGLRLASKGHLGVEVVTMLVSVSLVQTQLPAWLASGSDQYRTSVPLGSGLSKDGSFEPGHHRFLARAMILRGWACRLRAKQTIQGYWRAHRWKGRGCDAAGPPAISASTATRSVEMVAGVMKG